MPSLLPRGVLAILLCVFVSMAPAVAQQRQPGIQLDVPEAQIRRAKPGSILRVYPQVGGATADGKAFRIIYRSTGVSGEPVAVSGTVIYPDGPAPRDGRNVVAWAHYTTGVASRCAPTLLPNLSGTIAGLEQLLGQGYVVVATDYEGLGVPGVHAYLVGVSEARSVLDSVRAARNLSNAHASNRFVVWGHSQGGHAALFTGELAHEYAPELKLIGVAAAAPATNLVELFRAQQGSIAGDSLIAMAMLSWSRTYGIPLETVLEDDAKKSFERVAGSCIQSLPQMVKLLQLAKPLRKTFLKTDPTEIPAWRRLMEKNSPGEVRLKVPVFLAQGTGDKTIDPAITIRFAKRLCKQGTPVRLKMLNGVSHGFAAEKSAHLAVRWMDRLFDGRQPENDCGR
jgi:acetyl esterase/lipase